MNLAIEIPDNIFFGINETEQSLTQLLKEKLALELYKSHQISLSQGAQMLSLDIYEFMSFVSKHEIPVIDDYDIADEVALAKSILKWLLVIVLHLWLWLQWIGVVILAKDKGLIEFIRDDLEKLLDSNLFISQSLIDRVLFEVGEWF